jgi:hypothetical protein
MREMKRENVDCRASQPKIYTRNTPADIIHQWRRTATAMASQSHGNEAEAREAKVRESM